MKSFRKEFTILAILTLFAVVSMVYWLITKQAADTWQAFTYIAFAQMIRLLVVTRPLPVKGERDQCDPNTRN